MDYNSKTMHHHIFQDLLILLGFSVFVVLLLQKLKLPSILGFLLTGILIGPHAMGLIRDVEGIEFISEIGVILLLFVIGMELSIKQLTSIKNTVFIGGALQVGLTVLVSGTIYYALGKPLNESVFVGFLFSLSSTAIVLKVLQDRNELGAPHGRNALAILIFQDIIVVPMMLFTPIMAGQSENVGQSVLLLIAKTAVVIVITILSARYLVPRLMHQIAKTGSKELFLIATITICFAVAFLTAEAGLSLALGAFLAGLIISESEYSHQATSIILPFRELFTSFFFVSVGMLLDLRFFGENVGLILLLVLAVFIIKSLLAATAVAVLRYPPRTVILTGLSLFQVGEFAFILSKVGIKYDLLAPETNQYFLAISIVSMLLTPFVIILSERIALGMLQWKPLHQLQNSAPAPTQETQEAAIPLLAGTELHNHLVIIGYGINGRNVARAATFSKIPFVVIELNADTVIEERPKGVPILYGDASEPHILQAVHLTHARVVVVAISDAMATRNIIREVRHLSQTVHLIVRTRYVKEIDELLALGADDVIPEEFETSIEIFSRTLHQFLVPDDDIFYFTHMTRNDNYSLFQNKKQMPHNLRPSQLPNFDISCLKVLTDDRRTIGRAIEELDLRNRFEINVLGISRNNTLITNIRSDERIQQGDILYLTGDALQVDRFRKEVQ